MVLIKNPLSGGGGGGGDIVNSIVQEYQASTSDVEAGTFVEFVNTIGDRTQFDGSGTSISAEAVALEDGKVFVAFRKATYGDRYAVIATISGGAVSFGTEVLLSTNVTQSYANTYVDASPDKTKVLVFWRAKNNLNAVICCGVSGATITVGAEATLANGSDSFAGLGARGVEWLDDTRAFLGYAYAGAYAQGAVATVASDLSITIGTATVLNSTAGMFDMKVLSPTRVVFVENNTSGDSSIASLYAYYATVNGDTISTTSRTSISVGSIDSFYSLNSGSRGTLVRINSTDAAALFVGRPYGRQSGIGLWSCRLSTSGSPISAVSGNEIFGYGSTNGYASAITGARVFAGSDGPYAVINYNSGSLKLAKLRPAISGVAIKEFQAIATGSSVNTYGGAIIGANGLVFYGSSTKLYAYPLISQVKPAEIEISGLTKTEATTSSAGEVYVLNN